MDYQDKLEKMDNIDEYLKIKCFQTKMVRDRGYYIEPDEEFFLNEITTDMKQSFIERYISHFGLNPINYLGETLSKAYISNIDKIFIYYYVPKRDDNGDPMKISVELPRKLHDIAAQYQVNHVIFIINVEMTGTAEKEFAANIPPPTFEIFKHIEFLTDPVRQFLAPRLEIVTDKEILNTLEIKNLPYLREQDPHVKYLGIKEGTVVKMTRRETFHTESEIAESITYCVVRKINLEKLKKKRKKQMKILDDVK